MDFRNMCNSAKEHSRLIANTPHLDTLQGFDNRHRRVLRKAHKKQDGLCFWCGNPTPLWWEITTEEFIKIGKMKIATREHLIPQADGGHHTIDNIACACYGCNSLRGTIPVDQFKWVSANPKRLKRLKTLRAQKKQERAIQRKEYGKIRHARHVELMKTNKEKALAKKAKREELRKSRVEEAELNYMMKVGTLMQKAVNKGDIEMRKLQCQEQKKKNLTKAIKSSLGERVKRFFAMENLRTVSFKPVRSFCAFL